MFLTHWSITPKPSPVCTFSFLTREIDRLRIALQSNENLVGTALYANSTIKANILFWAHRATWECRSLAPPCVGQTSPHEIKYLEFLQPQEEKRREG